MDPLPSTGAYFFARPSVSVEHLFPSTPATDDPFRFPRPNVVLWPNQTPAIFSPPLPPTTLSDARPPHKKSRVPPPFSISLASPKCFLPTFFNAPLLTRMIGWLSMLPSLSHTSVLRIFLSSKPHKSSVPSMRKFVSRFSLDNSTLSLLTFLLSFLLLPPLLRALASLEWAIVILGQYKACIMSASCDISSTFPQESMEDVNDREPAFTAPVLPPLTEHFLSLLRKRSLRLLWMCYGARPSNTTDYNVPLTLRRSMSFVSFSNLLGTRMHVLVQLPGLVPWVILSRHWGALLMSGRTWKSKSTISPGDYPLWTLPARGPQLIFSPAYVLTRKGNPFHSLRPHGVLEVVWGHRTTAIALPKWINKYHCLGLFAQVCGPMLTPSCAIWCDDTRLCEELVECTIGSFVQVHIKACCSDLVRIDLQAALQRSIQTLHLPDRSLQDDLVQMKVFVPQGVTCFSGGTFNCTSSFENWQTVLREEGRRIYPGRNPDNMIFHRVHQAIEEVCPIFEPAVKHFILADADEQEHTRTVVFAIFASRFEFFGACHWTPTTRVWDVLDLCGGEKGWIIYHNNRRLRHQRVSVHHGDFFACYERCECTPLLLEDHPPADTAQEWVANAPLQLPGEATGPAPSEPMGGACSARNDASPTFETTGGPIAPHRKTGWSSWPWWPGCLIWFGCFSINMR